MITYVCCVSWIGVLEGTRDLDLVGGSYAASTREADLSTADVELKPTLSIPELSGLFPMGEDLPEEGRQGRGCG